MITIRKYGDITRCITVKTILGKSLFNANMYLLDGVVFDTGINTGDDIPGLNGRIDAVFVSHGHHDHNGNNAVLQQAHNCKVYCHDLGLQRIGSPDNSSFIECLYAGSVRPCSPERCPDSYDAQVKVESLFTPGHSKDHMCFYVPEKRALFSGDLVLWGKTRWVSDEVDIYDAMASLEKVSKLDIETIFPGHGRPFENPHEVLSQKIEHLRALEERIVALWQGGMRPEEIRDKVLGREELMCFLTRGRFSKLNLVKSYLAKHAN